MVVKTVFKLQSFIIKHHKFNERVEYDVEELTEMIDTARVLFSGEGGLIEVGIPCVVVGDIHGQFADLQRIFCAIGLPGRTRFLFLGDYVDRGPMSLECISLLVAWKIAHPKKVFLLRGNHEFASVNRIYGFYEELESRFSIANAIHLWKEFNNLFAVLPFAAVIKGRILCMHGGLSPRLQALSDIGHIKMPLYECNSETLEQDLVWADPKLDCRGFEPNHLRNVSVAFGEDTVFRMCKKFKLDLIVRAHQVMDNGYGFFAGRKLVTVFSAPMYSELNNKGAVMRISREMVISYMIFNPVTAGNAGAEHFKRCFVDDQRSFLMTEQNIAAPPPIPLEDLLATPTTSTTPASEAINTPAQRTNTEGAEATQQVPAPEGNPNEGEKATTPRSCERKDKEQEEGEKREVTAEA